MRVIIHNYFSRRSLDAVFKESEHPRAKAGEKAGEFVRGGGGGSSGSSSGEWTPGNEKNVGSKNFRKLIKALSPINKPDKDSFIAFHYTTAKSANSIKKQGLLKNKMNGIYMELKPSDYGREWGNVLVKVRVAYKDLFDLDKEDSDGLIYHTGTVGLEGVKQMKVKVVGIKQLGAAID